jgi:hypothetical protein
VSEHVSFEPVLQFLLSGSQMYVEGFRERLMKAFPQLAVEISAGVVYDKA